YWFRDSNGVGHPEGPTLTDTNGVTWLKPGKEYIVFLIPTLLCANISSGMYIEIWPYGSYSLSGGMFPIENGIVYDEGNDFGLGQYVPVEIFKAKIREIILAITTYGD
ncbi:hypothetical protein LLG34_04860, partial [bacterium]|nr:hypothetical protein [bacterium]